MTLSELQAEIIVAASQAAKTDPTAALSDLAQLRSLVDDLISDYVQQARGAGRSWEQIGTVLGLTKQGAQQRYTRHAV